jgi:hypothetical protein
MIGKLARWYGRLDDDQAVLKLAVGRRFFTCHFTEKIFRDIRKLVKESQAEENGSATRSATLPRFTS